MRLVQLIYASSFAEEMDVSELAKIREVANRENEKNSITGMLIAGNDFFLQCLEGGREAVNKLYSEIVPDPRHRHILLLRYSEVSRREFENWSMGFILLSEVKKQLILKYSTTTDFDPYKMSAESSHELLMALRKMEPKI